MPDSQGGAVRVLTGEARQMQNAGVYSGSFYGVGLPLPAIVEGQPIRQWDFDPGTNSIQTPRHTEPFNFRHLRAFSNVELVRMAIETRKDQLERLDWMVKPREEKMARRQERDPRCAEVEKFLAKPDGQTLFQPFFRAVEEDLLALDAACLERVRTRGGKLHALELVDGSTINLIVDNQGRRPRGDDDIAFQQVIRGTVWANLTNRDLLYAPRNVRTGHIYGFSPVEQIIVTVNTLIRRQASQLAYFTEGNVPQGIVSAPDGWTTEQIRDLQEWFDQRIGGNQAQQRSVIWTPNGAKYQAFKDSPIKDEFDEWLARIVAFAFSLPPTPFVRQMNKGTAGEDQERALEEGLEPLKQWRKRLIDGIIAEEFGYTDLEFAFKIERELDPKMQADIDDLSLRNGSVMIDEVRDARGLEPYPDGLGAKPRIYGGSAMSLEQSDAAAELKANPPPPPPVIAAPAAAAPIPPKAKAKPAIAEKLALALKKKALTLAKAKAPKIPPLRAIKISVDRAFVLNKQLSLKNTLKSLFSKARGVIHDQIDKALSQGNDAQQNLAEAFKIVNYTDWADLLNMHEPLLEGIETVALDVVSPALASIGVDDAKLLVDQVSEAAVAYARERAAELVSFDGSESLIATTRQELRDIIANGLENNVGKDQILSDIMESMAFSEQRAELIAHTEIAMANAAGKAAAWDQVKADGAILMKQWFASGLEGVCPICEANEEQGEIAYDDAFESGDEMEPAHPACRCVVTARVVPDTSDNAPDDSATDDDIEAVLKYSEDQPRDERGRFGSGSGSDSNYTIDAPTDETGIGDGEKSFGTAREMGLVDANGVVTEQGLETFASNWIGGSWQNYQDAAESVVKGESKEDFGKKIAAETHSGNYEPAMTMHEYTAGVMAKINESDPLAYPLYRGLVGVNYKVGDTFSESLTTWTAKESLARDFAHDRFNTAQTWGAAEHGAVIKVAGSGMHGINISELNPNRFEENSTVANAAEHITSGQYRVVSVSGSRTPTYNVERIGNAQKSDLKKVVEVELAKYSDDQPRDERGRWEGGGGSADVLFEVGPNPDNADLSARWSALSDSQKQAITDKISAEFTPQVLAAAGIEGTVEPALGGFEGDINPSLVLSSNNPFQAAGALGETFGQKAMVVMSDKPMAGLSPVGMVSVQVPGADAAGLRDMQGKIGDLADGFTYRDGRMEVLNFSGKPDAEFASAIDERLGGAYVVIHDTVYSSYIEAKDYARPESDSRGNSWRETASSLRAAFSQRLEETLQQVGSSAQEVTPHTG